MSSSTKGPWEKTATPCLSGTSRAGITQEATLSSVLLCATQCATRGLGRVDSTLHRWIRRTRQRCEPHLRPCHKKPWVGRLVFHGRCANHVSCVPSQSSLTGGGVKVGEFIDPVCGGSPPQGGLTQLEQRWSSLAGLTGFGSSDHVVLPARAAWLLDASMTVSTFTIRGSFRWDTSVDNLILSAGYVVVERGGSFELGTFEAPMLLRATIHILNLANVSHPYLGRRFLAIDGLSSSTLDEMFFAGGGQEMEEITVTLNDEAIEPGQTVTILHNGANVEIQVPQDARVGEPFQITNRYDQTTATITFGTLPLPCTTFFFRVLSF